MSSKSNSKSICYEKTPKLSLILTLREFPNSNIYTLLDSTQKLTNIHEIIIIADTIAANPEKTLQELVDKNVNLATLKIVEVDAKKGQGLAFSRNVGTKLSRSQNLLFIDDDAAILDDVAPLVEYLDEGICQGIQPLILRFGGEIIDSAGDFVKPKPAYYQVWVRHSNQPVESVTCDLKAEEVPSLRGAFMLFRKQSLLAVGGFDESYYYQWDDVDVGWRMTIAGFKLLFIPSIRGLHKGGETTDLKLQSRKKSMKFEILNSTATRLKVARLYAWPEISAHFLKLLFYYEATARDRRKVDLSLHLMIKESMEMFLLILKRFSTVAYHRRMLNERFTSAGLGRFRAMVQGEHFVFHLPIDNSPVVYSEITLRNKVFAETDVTIPV